MLPPRLRPWGRYGWRLLAVAACYYAGARVGLLQALVNDQVTPLWPPTGVGLLALLLGGLRMWPGIALGALAVNASFGNLWWASVISAGNTLGPVATYLLLRRVGLRRELDRPRDAIALVSLGLAGMLVSATVGSGSLVLSGAVGEERFWSSWLVWWTGDAMGALVVVPLGLAVEQTLKRGTGRGAAHRWAEAAVLFATTTAVMLVATTDLARLLYLLFPFLIWGALRFQHLGTAPCALIACVVAARGASVGAGPFSGSDLAVDMVTLQAYNGTVVLSGLVLSAVIAERNAGRRAIERTCAQLAEVVAKYPPPLGELLPEQRGDR
ncbi:MASE1 domain-containing protein [Saccharothrix coeruleofusca]|uniref:Membrane protein n=1 Tax=Saccharothrix coeruleofusca TaxID=33919 RepID=A0A918AN25_9PSEU|nr:MASE1 domain-containing protein [Saccharothrix coeruleofusca]GGP61928.1 membrane protein [Saccharothrix coeruleofusca]